MSVGQVTITPLVGIKMTCSFLCRHSFHRFRTSGVIVTCPTASRLFLSQARQIVLLFQWFLIFKSLLINTVVQKCHSFSFYCAFYKRRPIAIIFGTQYSALICSATVIDLPPHLCTAVTLPWGRGKLMCCLRLTQTVHSTSDDRATAG